MLIGILPRSRLLQITSGYVSIDISGLGRSISVVFLHMRLLFPLCDNFNAAERHLLCRCFVFTKTVSSRQHFAGSWHFRF